MKKRIWCQLLIAVMTLFILSGIAMARANELNYYKAYEEVHDGEVRTSLEIGLKKNKQDYTVEVDKSDKKTLIINMENANKGKLQEHVTRNEGLVETIDFSAPEKNKLKVNIKTKIELNDGENYSVSTLPADRKQSKPFRLLITFTKKVVPEKKMPSYDGVSGHTIVIDPGHGGSDSGAVGPNGVTEKSVTLAVATKVEKLLTASGANVIMTRIDDRDVYGVNATDAQELQARVDYGERNPQTDIFISIHCNAFGSSAAHGMETYYYYKTSADQRLAELLNEELAKNGERFNRGVKEARFYVMRHSSMPASLVELAFITNYEEESLLADDSYQDKLAAAIAEAVRRYFVER